MNDNPQRRSIALVHGGFVDGPGWQGVYDNLKADGYTVAIVQNPTISLEGDVAATHRVIDARPGPVTLVGHSYGGAVITEAGSHEKVASLVYITAFAPDKGESVATLIADRGPVPRCRRSCRRPEASCSWTAPSSRTSPVTCPVAEASRG